MSPSRHFTSPNQYSDDEPPDQVDEEKQQQRRPVDAIRVHPSQQAAERTEERHRHACEDVVELIEKVVKAAIAPAKRRLRYEEENPGEDHPREDEPLEKLQRDENDFDEWSDETHLPSRSKDRAADAHDRRSLFDRDLVVVTHPHRQLFQSEVISNRIHLAEPAARIVVLRRNGHESAKQERIHRCDLLRDRCRVARIGAAFLLFASDVDLQQYVLALALRFRGARDFFREVQRVDGLDDVEELDRVFRFVRLQMPDEVPDWSTGFSQWSTGFSQWSTGSSQWSTGFSR